MWFMTTEGFYSVVQKPGDEFLTVRTRARGDLERLRDSYLPELGEIISGGGTDYPYRARVEAMALGRALATAVAELRYPNFKSAVASSLGDERAHVLGDVWRALRELTAIERRTSASDAYGGVVLDDEGRILLREPTGHYGGYVWTFAKGRARPGEAPDMAALREVREETGVTARIVRAIPGDFAGDTSITRFYVMRRVTEHDDFDRAETSRIFWATPDEAREMIGQTESRRGRARDLAVLRAVLTLGLDPRSGT